MTQQVWKAADYTFAMQSMLPRGRVWPRDPGAVITQVLAGLALTWLRHSQAGLDLLTDAFPASAYQLLPEWEETLGLPDLCTLGEELQVSQRQQMVVAKLTNSGGQSIPYYVAFAKALGYLITITEFSPSTFGEPFGSPFGGDNWAYTWQVNAPTFLINYLNFGGSFGLPFASWGSNVLQCELRKVAPAHTILLFNYEADTLDNSFILDVSTLS